MIRRDPQPVPEVEAVRIRTVGGDSRVEVELAAALTAALGLHPGHDRVGVAAPAQCRSRNEVVDVQEPPPSEALASPEPCSSSSILVARLEGRDEAVSRPPLPVDQRGEGVDRAGVWPQLQKRGGSPSGFTSQELADLGQ